MVRAANALGEKDKAQDAMARLLMSLPTPIRASPSMQRAMATGVTATPRDSSPGAQRNYLRTSLEKFGPEKWEPYTAPALDVKDSDGKRVTLDEYKGKNVILVFYLGAECPHCARQLHAIGEKKADWDRLNAVVLAVSSATPESNSAGLKAFGDLPIRLLSDDHFANAHRFHSYDDFEEMELHSTILIDKQGRVYWARNGGDPFSDVALPGEASSKRMNKPSLAIRSASVGPFHQFHHQRADSAIFFEPVDRRNIRMIERCQHLRLALQSRQSIGVVEERRGKRLDGDVAIQSRIARAIDFAHAAGAQRSGDLIGAESSSNRESHIAYLPAGTRRRSSSNQFTTPRMVLPVARAGLAKLFTRKRVPSGDTSQPMPTPPSSNRTCGSPG
jgi:peroxiredoxin